MFSPLSSAQKQCPALPIQTNESANSIPVNNLTRDFVTENLFVVPGKVLAFFFLDLGLLEKNTFFFFSQLLRTSSC